MKKTKKAFSIIEVVTASIILAIAVFGIFKLISENQKIINNSDNLQTANSLFLSFKECLENIKPNVEKNYLNLNTCSSGTTKTGITINNNDYFLSYSGITDNKFLLQIENESIVLKKEYYLKK